jgi:guanylate kinase
MLAVFYGCSCVGKTTIMKALCTQFEWQFLTIYTTRKARPGEHHKVSLDRDVFEYKETIQELLLVNECYLNLYGVSTQELAIACAQQDTVWMLDFSLSNQHQIGDFENTRQIVILPESENQLARQANEANRSNRIFSMIQEYRRYYVGLKEGINNDLNALCIVNAKGAIEKSVVRIRDYVHQPLSS